MAEPVTITADNFETEVLRATGPVLVDFWAPWCSPCRVIGPVVEEFATQYAGKLKVAKLNVDEHSSIAMRYHITGIPALLFFNNGQVVDTVVGAVPKSTLQKHVDDVITQFSPA
jgi:thioredoxin 1